MFEYNCRGCATYEDVRQGVDRSLIYCSYRIVNKDGRCPCTKCVVKVMCETACVVYNKYVKKLRSEGLIREN